MLDRIDIHIKVPLMDDEKISRDRIEESSKAIVSECNWRAIFNKTFLDQRIN